jgi:hypothetical protein
MSLTLHQLEHYSFHTSNKTYFQLQIREHVHFHSRQLNVHTHRPSTPSHEQRGQRDQPTNTQITSGANLRESKSLGQFSQSCDLQITGLSNILNNWDCTYANEFPVAVEDVNQNLHTSRKKHR